MRSDVGYFLIWDIELLKNRIQFEISLILAQFNPIFLTLYQTMICF